MLEMIQRKFIPNKVVLFRPVEETPKIDQLCAGKFHMLLRPKVV